MGAGQRPPFSRPWGPPRRGTGASGLVESKDLELADLEGCLCHKRRGFNNRHLLLQGSGGPESKIKALAGLIPSVRQNLFSACSELLLVGW